MPENGGLLDLLAGVVESVGASVTGLKPGDEGFGVRAFQPMPASRHHWVRHSPESRYGTRDATRARMTGRPRSGQTRRKPPSLADRFRDGADQITRWVGTPWTMGLAALVIVVWAATGPIFGFSDTWQLVINTATTIVTFLMVFAIQTSQNRGAEATQLKLDELIRATKGARNRLIDEEHRTQAELEADERAFERKAQDQ
jgi:low affinity Fe/Cu permease